MIPRIDETPIRPDGCRRLILGVQSHQIFQISNEDADLTSLSWVGFKPPVHDGRTLLQIIGERMGFERCRRVDAKGMDYRRTNIVELPLPAGIMKHDNRYKVVFRRRYLGLFDTLDLAIGALEEFKMYGDY